MNDFITGSSEAAAKLDLVWDNTLKPFFNMVKPLADSAEGLIKLLKLAPKQ
ncbi:hypothetical protein [Corynebacterium sp. p3-SID1194]|uniref:hypothetical protein n=1 Tax=Corynebacterium sp. p3-SID1194 TaxID=2916105 RepID=UPI0021A7932F|nr:hypothetical protein [Corynebacterium sp. p3-SID1194]MCT1450915.1 hypothetical protein [Corynebacterium sp. p3-SID1194]